jgi:hypothetical protein
MGDSVAESGSNAGSNFTIARYTDAGAPIDAPLAIARSTGVVDFKSTPTVSGVPIGGGGGTVYMQDTPPVGAPDKSLWVETDSGLEFVRWNDGNSTQWVQTTSSVFYTATVLNFSVTAAPSSPRDGDMWRQDNTNTGLKIRIAGVTKTITVS